MNRITGLKIQARRNQRVNVYLDGEYAFSLEREVAVKAGLRIGQEITPGEAGELTGQDLRQKCYNSACRFLSYRPRSEREVRQRLRQQGHEPGHIEHAVSRLKELGLLDDAEFARLWADNREEFSPRGRRLLKMELQQKGLSREIIEQAVSGLDEGESAYRAALKKARSLPGDDYEVFRKRLAAYLGRRGFGYETLMKTIDKIWKERDNSTS